MSCSFRLLTLVGCGALVWCGAGRSGGRGKPARPYGLDRRVAWTTSRVIGSPDPPPPYRTRRVFDRLKFDRPVYLSHEPNTDRLLVVEQGGRVLAFPNERAVAKADVFCTVKDADTYSLTFHPHYAKNGYVYVFSNGPNSAQRRKNRILRFTVKGPKPRRCDPRSEKLIIEWESNGHNGGDLAFGNDGYLYITSGDGTSDSDGDLTGQDLRDLASGIIRIDVDHPNAKKGYAVPKDNPFLKVKGARPELWAFGLRNPWRLSCDRKTGDLWVGDVGQDLWEMIHLIKRGGNYGWSVYEGSHPFQPKRQRGPGPFLKPIIEHPHSESRSITGGFVYYGKKLKKLRGAYVYGDYSTGKIWALRYAHGKVTWRKELASTRLQIVGFGQDRMGELYIVDYAGQIHQLEPRPPDKVTTRFPRKLSETGLFTSTARHQVHPALIPYSVNAPLWSDGAAKERFIALPGKTRIQFTEEGAWGFPEGTVLVKTFSLELKPGDPSSRRRIETRLLTLQQGEWVGYSYLWNKGQTDADLVEAAGADRVYPIKDPKVKGSVRKQTWRFPSRTECMVCHSRAAGFVLGLNTLQMNKVYQYGRVADNQLRTLEHLGIFRVNTAEHLAAWEGRIKQKWAALRKRFGPARPWLSPRAGVLLDQSLELLTVPLETHWAELRQNLAAEIGRTAPTTKLLPKWPEELPRLVDPSDVKASLHDRARSYLHANCAQCHVIAGGGNSAIDLHWTTAPANMRLFGVKPLHDKFGIQGALLVAPRQPERSVLFHRVGTLGRGRMPPLASSVVDREAVKMLRDWIRGLPPQPARPKARGKKRD
jgi:glucose/arabinose dehydrogenase